MHDTIKIVTAFLWSTLALLLHLWPVVEPMHAQGTREDDNFFNSRGVPLAGASVRICATPATGRPCTPLRQIYSDVALTQATANATTTAGMGSYHFFTEPEKYEVEISGRGITNEQLPDENLDADLHSKDPNTYYDLTRYGLYTGPGAAIRCSITKGANKATCPGGISDFAVGQGIEIPLAGIGSAFPAWGVTAIDSFSRINNVASYTIKSRNVPVPGAGQTVTITSLSDSSFNGRFTVTGNDGDFGHFFTSTSGPNVSTTASSGTATLTSATIVITPHGILNGSTTYNYKVVRRGYHGELSAASPAGTTSIGAATLGPNTVSVSSCARSSGVVTCTTSATHNFQAGAAVDLEGSTQFGSTVNQYNGTHIIASTPTSTTFTFYQASLGADSGTDTGGTAKVVAKNLVQWDMVPYSVLQSIVYRSINGGAYSIVGIVEGMDGAFVDWGLSAPAVPAYIPSTPPSSTTNGILATTITNISGTTLTLAANAANTATRQTAQHDNTPIVLAGCAALASSGGGELLIAATKPLASAQFTSPLDLYDNCPGQVTITFAITTIINDPIIMKNAGTTLRSAPGSQLPGQQFQNYSSTRIVGIGYPFFYFVPGSFGPNTLTNLSMECFQPYQSCVVQDQDQGGGGVANVSYDNDSFMGNAGAMPFIMRSGGFNFWFTKGQFAVQMGGWGVPESLQITLPNALGGTSTQGNGWTLTNTLAFDKTVFQGHGIEFNNWGQPGTITGNLTLTTPLIENPIGPFMSVYLSNSGLLHEVKMTNAAYADFLSGPATPFIALYPGTRISGFISDFAYCANGYQPLFEGFITGGVQITQADAAGCGLTGTIGDIAHNLNRTNTGSSYDNANLALTGTARVFSAMGAPGAPSLALSAGGSVPIGAHTYQIAAIDTFGGSTLLGPGAGITVTAGNQTVTVTPPVLPTGAVGWQAFRDTATAAFLGCTYNPRGVIPATTAFVDSFGYICGNYTPSSNTAGATIMGPFGLAASQVNLVGSGFADVMSGKFTANRTATMPDVSGMIPVSSYLNSSYDTFNRANGAIGGNWTVTDGGFNVASNLLRGTGGVNLAYWSANAFSNVQFAQAAVPSLNGTTDFVGVQVLMSPSGNGYTCVENSATLLLQKMIAFASTNLTSSTSAGAAGDILRLEVSGTGVLTCSRNAGGTITSITATDTTYTSGSPGLEQFGSVATMGNWSGGNLHPIAQMDSEQDWTKMQHFGQGVAIASEPLSASPRAEQDIFLPGALTSTWTASTWTTDKAITVTRVQVQAKTVPAGCGTNAVVRITDGTTPVNLTISSAANDSGSISQNYPAGAALRVVVQTAAAGCTTSPADANVVVQYRMQ